MQFPKNSASLLKHAAVGGVLFAVVTIGAMVGYLADGEMFFAGLYMWVRVPKVQLEILFTGTSAMTGSVPWDIAFSAIVNAALGALVFAVGAMILGRNRNRQR